MGFNSLSLSFIQFRFRYIKQIYSKLLWAKKKEKFQKWDWRPTISVSLYQNPLRSPSNPWPLCCSRIWEPHTSQEAQQWRPLQGPWLSSSPLTPLPPPQPTRDFTCTPRHTAHGGLEREWLPDVWASLYVLAVDSLLFGVSRRNCFNISVTDTTATSLNKCLSWRKWWQSEMTPGLLVLKA